MLCVNHYTNSGYFTLVSVLQNFSDLLVSYVVHTYQDRFGCFDNPSFEHGCKTKLATASASQRTQPTGYGLLAS